MRESFFERQQLSFAWTEVSFGKQRDSTALGEAPLHVTEQEPVAVLRAIHWHDAAGRADQRPEQTVAHHRGRVGEEMDARLGGKQQKQADGVHPPEMVGDDHERAIGNALAAGDLKAEQQMKGGPGDSPHDSKRKSRMTADRQHVGRWDRHLRHFSCGLETECIPTFIQADASRWYEAGPVQYSSAVVAVEV